MSYRVMKYTPRVYYNSAEESQPGTSQEPRNMSNRGKGAYRGGRGGKKFTRREFNERAENTRNPPPIKTEIASFPEPKHLSKTSRELSNDPLYEEFFREFGSSLRRNVDDPKIHSMTHGLK